MGLTTGFGGGRNLVQLLGYQKAMRMLISNRILNAQQALQVGLVDAVIENGEVRLAYSYLELYLIEPVFDVVAIVLLSSSTIVFGLLALPTGVL